MLIQCVTGFENFSNASAKSHVFVVPTSRHPGKEMHIGVAARGGFPGVSKAGAPNTTPAAPGLLPELGAWVSQGYNVPDGLILKIFASRSGGWSSMRVMANQFIQMRDTAAYRDIAVILTGAPHASLSRAHITGRFDLLSLEDAMNRGVLVPPSFRGSFDPALQSRSFEYRVIEPETRSAATVTTRTVDTSSGSTVSVPVAERKRALDL